MPSSIFTRAVELDPDLTEAHVGLGTLHSAGFHGLLGNDASFRAEEERGLSSGASILNTLATVHAKRGDTERAVELLRISLRKGRTTVSFRQVCVI